MRGGGLPPLIVVSLHNPNLSFITDLAAAISQCAVPPWLSPRRSIKSYRDRNPIFTTAGLISHCNLFQLKILRLMLQPREGLAAGVGSIL